MIYGHAPSVFIEDGPTEQLAKTQSARSTARSWRVLDEARRIELVERALSAANDCFDGFPIAL